MATKKTKTIQAKSYIYDFSKDGLTDSYKTVAITKFNTNLRDWERDVIASKSVDDFFNKMSNDIMNYYADNTEEINIKASNLAKVEKKPNVFKRFWNWITRKK